MTALCEQYVLEFGSLIIEKFGLDSSPQSFLEMWTNMIETSVVSIKFSRGVENKKATKSKSEKEVKTPQVDNTTVGCSKILSSGANKGKECGKKCVGDSLVCVKHTVVDKVDNPIESNDKVDDKKCARLLTSGANKGNECGKKCAEGIDTCTAHSKVSTKVPKTKDGSKPESKPDSDSDEQPVKVPKSSYKLTVKPRDNGLLVATNQTPNGSFFVFDNKKDRLVCGKLTPDEQVVDLDEEDVKFCTENNIKMSVIITNKDTLEDILDDIQTH